MAVSTQQIRLDWTGDWLGRLCLKHVNRAQSRKHQTLLSEMSMPLDTRQLPDLGVEGVEVRSLTGPGEIRDFVRLHNRAYVGSSDYQRAGWVQRMALQASGCFDPSMTWFALKDGRPIGFCMARLKGTKGIIAGLGVLPQYRRRGVATLLMVRAMETLAWRGADSVHLYVPRADAAPQAMYRKLGFQYHRAHPWAGTEKQPPVRRGLVARLCLAYVRRGDQRREGMWRSMTMPLAADYPFPEPGAAEIRPLGGIRNMKTLVRMHNRAYVGASDYLKVNWIHATALKNSRGFDPSLIWIAHRDGKPVGYCMARDYGGTARIAGVAVLPPYRRQGIGTELLRHCLAALSLRGVSTVILEVPRSDRGSQAMYHALGFQYTD